MTIWGARYGERAEREPIRVSGAEPLAEFIQGRSPPEAERVTALHLRH